VPSGDRGVPELLDFAGINLTSAMIFALNCIVDFLPMDGNFRRRFDPEPNFITTNINDRYDDLVADHDAFIALS